MRVRRMIGAALAVLMVAGVMSATPAGAADAIADANKAELACSGEIVQVHAQGKQYGAVRVPPGGKLDLSGSGWSTLAPRGLGPNGLPLWRTGGLLDLRVFDLAGAQQGYVNNLHFLGPTSIESASQPADVAFTVGGTISLPAGGYFVIESEFRFWFDGQPYDFGYQVNVLDSNNQPVETPPQHCDDRRLDLMGFEDRQSTEHASDPVQAHLGSFTDRWTDIDFFGNLSPLSFERAYNSLDSRVGVLGRGWSTLLDMDITAYGSDLVVRGANGRGVRFAPDGNGGWTRPREFRGDLIDVAGGRRIDFDDGSAWHFDANGRIGAVSFWSGEEVVVNRSGAQVTSVDLVHGATTLGSLTFSYAADGRLAGISSSDGRAVTYGYQATSAGARGLVSIVDAAGDTSSFVIRSSDSLITQVVDGAGRTVVENTYDATARVSRQDFPSGDFITYVYDDVAGTTTVTDGASGDVTVIGHNGLGQRDVMTDATASTANYAFTSNGYLDLWTDRAGNAVDLTVEVDGDVTNVLDRTGRETRMEYDSENRPTAMEVWHDESSSWARTEFRYDPGVRIPKEIEAPDSSITQQTIIDGLVTQSTDPDGVITTFTYTDRRVTQTQVSGVVGSTSYVYDGAGRVTSVTYPDGGQMTTTYDGQGRPLTTTDPEGGTTAYTYDGSGRLLTQTDPDGSTTTYTYDSSGRLDTMTDALGNVTTYSWSVAGDLVGITRPGGSASTSTYGALARLTGTTDPTVVGHTMGYDANGRRTTTTDGNGDTVTTTYDAEGRVTVVTDPLGNSTSTTYDSAGRVSSNTDATGATTTYAYDVMGRLATTTFADGGVESRTYTGGGRLATTTDPLGNVTTYGYDAAGRLATVTDAAGGVTTFTRDDVGRITSVTSPAGQVTSTNFDLNGRVTSTTDASGDTSSLAYSAGGDLLSRTDPTATSMSYAYDAENRVTSTTNANGGITSYGYDTRGNRISRTSASTTTDTWAYDAADRLTTATDPLGNAWSITYDSVGRVATRTDATGRSVAYTYDAAGRVVQADHTHGTDTYTATYGYDAAGRRTTATDQFGTLTYSYDTLGRLTGVLEADGDTIGYAYDAAGNLTALTYPDGSVVTYTYDALNRLATVAEPTFGTTTYTYDADSRLIAEALPDGNTRAWTYTDDLLTGYSDSQLGASTLAYDANDRLTSITGPENWTFAYDAAGQLTSADRDGRTWTYNYDAVGNLTEVVDSIEGTSTFVVDAANRLVSGTDPVGATSYTYDAAGRILSATAGDGSVTTWDYDVRGLTRLITTEAAGSAPVEPDCANLTFTIVGTPGDDVLTGTAGVDIIDGGDGADTIDGLGGADIICGGDGADIINGGGGRDMIAGGRGADTINGDNGADQIWGNNGKDVIDGGNGVDFVDGGNGDDTITGGAKGDTLLGSSGADTISGNGGADIIHGGGNTDTLNGDGGNDVLVGNGGADVLNGGSDADELYGMGGNDELNGNGSTDFLDGGNGTDVLNGGGNVDECDEGETTSNCETITNNPGSDPPDLPTAAPTIYNETRNYDVDGRVQSFAMAEGGNISSVDVVWDPNSAVEQVLETSGFGSGNLIYGLSRVGAVSPVGTTETFAYNPLGDTIEVAGSVRAAGTAYSPHGDVDHGLTQVSFGYRGEMHVGANVFLRARDLNPDIGRFTSTDPLDGLVGLVVETNPYHYANNDPINMADPTGLRAVPAEYWLPCAAGAAGVGGLAAGSTTVVAGLGLAVAPISIGAIIAAVAVTVAGCYIAGGFASGTFTNPLDNIGIGTGTGSATPPGDTEDDRPPRPLPLPLPDDTTTQTTTRGKACDGREWEIGPYGTMATAAPGCERHHIVQHQAVQSLRTSHGYSKSRSIAILLTRENHRLATNNQDGSDECGATYGGELNVARSALAAANVPAAVSVLALFAADAYFSGIGVTSDTGTTVPRTRWQCRGR